MEFAEAFALVEAHDVDGLRAAVGAHPELPAVVGKGGNDLLAFAAGTCDERLVRVLLDAGADVAVHDATHDATPAGVGRARRPRGSVGATGLGLLPTR